MRLAWFSPWPPDSSGIAGRSAELVPILADRGHAVDVFVDERRHAVSRTPPEAPRAGTVRIIGAHDFLWRHGQYQYDLAVYQLGNSRLHQFIWPYVWQVPGLVVLHDARLHHARGHAWLSRKAPRGYRAEFGWSEPAVAPAAAELAIAGYGGAYYYLWPMVRAVVESARVVAAHSGGAVAELAERYPAARLRHIALGEGSGALPSTDIAAKARTRFSISADAVVFGVFGGLTHEKRVLPVLRAFSTLVHRTEPVHLLLAGEPDPSLDLAAVINDLGLAPHVTTTGRLEDAAFDEAIAVADVSINLRWPSALEVSGPWLRALAAARPTIVLDLIHLSHLPTLDPRTWQLHVPAPAGRTTREAVAIAIDILDEEHSLILAMRRLAFDADLRARLGTSGRAYWQSEHTVARMADDYDEAMAEAVTTPAPAPLPSPFRPDPAAHARELVARFGVGPLFT
jgi:glycosyltransferase involved in cell wall biosynthesis